MYQTAKFATVAGLCSILALSGGLPASCEDETNNPNVVKTTVGWTPILMRSSVSPQPFQGSDGKYNLVYELVLTNEFKNPADITEIKILDADTGKAVQTLAGNKSIEAVFSQPSGVASTTLRAGGSGIVWVNLTFDKPEDVPKRLVHELTFSTKRFMVGDRITPTYRGAATEVVQEKPVVVGSPLRGGKWVAIGGYCGLVGHRRTLLPVDNKLVSAQRYAIDWVRLDEDNYATRGPKLSNATVPAYDQPIYAVADGTIEVALDSFDEQKLFKPTGVNRYTHPAGNCIVQDIGGGRHAMYAHLKPGSLKVKPGDQVKKGDVIAHLGNSGNTTGPHLHFHVVDDQSVLGSNGVPYVFEEFTVVGEVPDLKNFFRNTDKGRKQAIGDTKDKGKHQLQLVKEGHIVEF